MKYGLKFYCEKSLNLPVNYNKILQAALLNWLDDGDYSKFLHDKGYTNERKKYKLFTFSNIKGDYIFKKENKTLTFNNEIIIVLSFYTNDSHDYILKNIRENKPIRFGESYAEFMDCGVAEEYYKSCVVDTVSPITVHTTLEKPDGKKFTYYYEPHEKGFKELIVNNLINKIEAICGEKPLNTNFNIKPYNNKKQKRITTNYGGLIIKGWQGSFEINGSSEMIKMALLSGIGDRNSIGFGCVLQNNSYSV